jgi:hypothetical protein
MRFFGVLLLALPLSMAWSGVPIDINQQDYEKFVAQIDKTLQESPHPWEDYKIVGKELILPSGAKFGIEDIKILSHMTYDELLNEFSKRGLAVKVYCDARKNFKKEITSTPCNKKEEFNSEFLKENINAQYVSQFSTLNKANKPELLIRADAPKYSVIHEYIHHLQETVPPAFIKDYRLKSLRVALGDSLFEKGEKKRNNLDKLVFQELRLVQWLLDEAENYAAMLKFYEIFNLHFSDAHEVFWKFNTYVSQCGSKKCKAELARAQEFFAKAQENEVKKRSPEKLDLSIPPDIIEKHLLAQASASKYEDWFKSLKKDIYEKNNLYEVQQENLKLYELLNKPEYPYKDKKEGFEKLLVWMAKNAVIQFRILDVSLSAKKGELKFKNEMEKDRDYFKSFLK